MVDLKNIQSLYFIGIGGIGMSALARYFASQGKNVSGYDRTETPLTKTLVDEGMPITYSDDPEAAPREVDLVVYTPAIPAGNQTLNYYRNNHIAVVKRSDVLGAITEHSFNICVAGTHGKTTISTMIAHILRHTGYGCNAFLGGISTNYNSNFWSSERNTCVIEADEYDRSFLKLSPDIAVITAMDADHLDIYGTEKEMQDAFVQFSLRLKKGGHLYMRKGLSRENELEGITYSLDEESAAVHAKNIRNMNGYYLFDLSINGEVLEDFALNMGGLHNVENASVAIAVARQLNIATESIRDAVEEFRGVKRRFEYIIKKKQLVYIDDYAHHPQELRSLITSAKQLFGKMKCTVVFQPHLYSRTRDLADEFAKSLDLADEVILLPIYPARELPIEGVSSELIRDRMENRNVRIVEKKNLIQQIRDVQLLITAGAGDIDTLVEPVKKLLNATI